MKDKDTIISRIHDAENWRDVNYRADWEKDLRLYRFKLETERVGANIFVPYIFMMCETVKSRLSESLFDRRPYLTINPLGVSLEQSDKVQALLDWQFCERMDLPKIYSEEVVHNLCVLGTAVQFVGWERKTRKTKRMSQVDELVSFGGQPLLDETGMPISMPSRVEEEYEKVEYDDPIVSDIDIFDFFVDPSAVDIPSARFCGHMEYKTKSELKNLEETDNYKIDWKKLNPASEIEGGMKSRMETESKSNESLENTNGLYLVHHYWEDNRHVVVVNRQEIVLDEPNPFWHGMKPYDKCCYVYLPHQFYGIGIPRIAAGLQEELNTTRNQRIDFASFAIRRPFKARLGSGLTEEDLVWENGRIIWLQQMDDVDVWDVPDIPASIFTNEATIKQDMRDATGCHDILMGLANSNETATTTMTKDTNASVRFKYVVSNIVKDLLIPLGKKCLSLNQQFMTEERQLHPAHSDKDELLTISPFEIDGDYDIIFSGSAVDPAANKELQKQRMIEAYNIVANDPLYQQDFNAKRAIIKQLFEALEVKDVEALLPTQIQGSPVEGMIPLPIQPPQGGF